MMARFSQKDGNLQSAGFAFNRALQKLATTLRTKKSAESSETGGSFVEKLKQIYSKYDPDNNGLDIEEFKNAMEQEGIPELDAEMIEGVFLILDPDRDGTVTYDEFTYGRFMTSTLPLLNLCKNIIIISSFSHTIRFHYSNTTMTTNISLLQ